MGRGHHTDWAAFYRAAGVIEGHHGSALPRGAKLLLEEMAPFWSSGSKDKGWATREYVWCDSCGPSKSWVYKDKVKYKHSCDFCGGSWSGRNMGKWAGPHHKVGHGSVAAPSGSEQHVRVAKPDDAKGVGKEADEAEPSMPPGMEKYKSLANLCGKGRGAAAMVKLLFDVLTCEEVQEKQGKDILGVLEARAADADKMCEQMQPSERYSKAFKAQKVANDAATSAHKRHAKAVKDLQEAEKEVERLKELVEASSAKAELCSAEAKEATIELELATKELQHGAASNSMEVDGVQPESQCKRKKLEDDIQGLREMLDEASKKLAEETKAGDVGMEQSKSGGAADEQEDAAFRKIKASNATAAARAKAAPYSRPEAASTDGKPEGESTGGKPRA